jgi:D-aminoacyl-tRNA deacylase
MPKIVFAQKNEASLNIANKLISDHGFDESGDGIWIRDGIELVRIDVDSILDVPTSFDTDYLIVLSTHKSAKGGRMLTAHFPGNWADALMGGEPRTLNMACASRLKIMIEEISRANESLGWPVSIEADHHGPVCQVPTMFVEIGSSEDEWGDDEAGSAVASAVSSAVRRDEEYEAVLGFGGGHYAHEFTNMVLGSPVAISHIAPKYAIDSLDSSMVRQAVEKTAEDVKKAVVIKDGTNARQKSRIEEICAELGLEYVCKDLKRK